MEAEVAAAHHYQKVQIMIKFQVSFKNFQLNIIPVSSEKF